MRRDVRRHYGLMTKEELIARNDMVKRQCHSVVCQILCGVYFSMLLAIILLVVFLCMFFFTVARVAILYELGSCIFVFACILVIYQRWTGKLKKLGMYCPSCHKWLESSVAETGKCSQCGERIIFDA